MPYKDKDKQKQYQANWVNKKRARDPKLAEKDRENRQALWAEINAYKIEHGCVDCGYNKSVDALQFDHLPEYEKRAGVTQLVPSGRKAVYEEMQKCELRCANCHVIIIAKRRRGKV